PPHSDQRTDLHQLPRNRLDERVDAQPVDGGSLDGSDPRPQRPARPDDARRAPLDITADDIEDQVDPADVVEILVVEVEELVRAEVERGLAVRRPPGTDDVGAELPGELSHHGSDRAGGAVREDALPCLNTTVLD